VLWARQHKTTAESLAQNPLVHRRDPVADSLGRSTSWEVLSLEELGRPPHRMLVVNCSVCSANLFINQMGLIDQGVEDGRGVPMSHWR